MFNFYCLTKNTLKIHNVSYYNIMSLIFVLEEVFYLLYTLVPSIFNFLSIVFITYLFNTGCFLHGELFVLSETVNILLCNIILVYIAMIFCVYITNLFIYISHIHGFKEKYPILYNVIILFFTIIFFVLFLMFAFEVFNLYSYTLTKVVTYISNIVNNIIKSILKTNGINQQGWYHQPYGNQPSGGGGPSGGGFPGGGPPGGGPSGGPSWAWGSDNQNNRRRPLTSCGEDSCYTGTGGNNWRLMKCINDFNEKAYKRYVLLNDKYNTDHSLRTSLHRRKIGWNSNIGRITGNTKVGYTKHELESFVKMINIKNNNVERLIVKSSKYSTANINVKYKFATQFHGKITHNAFYVNDDAILYLNKYNEYDTLDNATLYEIMKESNIFFIKK